MKLEPTQKTLRRSMITIALFAIVLAIYRWEYLYGYSAFLSRMRERKIGASRNAPGPAQAR